MSISIDKIVIACSPQGCAQVSLADFDPRSVLVRWYNVLSFRFMQSDLKGHDAKGHEVKSQVPSTKWLSGQSQPSSSSSSEGVKQSQRSIHAKAKLKQTQDKTHQLLEASSAKLRQAASRSGRGSGQRSSQGSGSDDQASSAGSMPGKRSQHPVVTSLKEGAESSDESTVISSQTSTLTRNHGRTFSILYCI